MAKVPTGPIVIRYNGLFDFDGFYSAMIDWCKNMGFLFQEDTYKHKVPSPTGAEQEFTWKAEKETTNYVKNSLTISGHLWDASEVTVEKNGKKKKLTKGRFEIVIVGTLITDWQKKWKGSKFKERLGKIYEGVIIKKEIEGVHWDEMYYRVWNLHAILKKYFDMQTKWHEYKKYLGED